MLSEVKLYWDKESDGQIIASAKIEFTGMLVWCQQVFNPGQSENLVAVSLDKNHLASLARRAATVYFSTRKSTTWKAEQGRCYLP